MTGRQARFSAGGHPAGLAAPAHQTHRPGPQSMCEPVPSLWDGEASAMCSHDADTAGEAETRVL